MLDARDIAVDGELLASYLAAESEERSREVADELFAVVVDPYIRVALAKYRTLGPDDVDEIFSRTRLRLLTKLQKLRDADGGEIAPIENIAAYVKAVTRNARVDHLLRKHPEWRHASNRIKHLAADPERGLRIFYDDERTCCIGLEDFAEVAGRFDLATTIENIRSAHPRHIFLPIQELAPIVLKTVGHAVYRNDLVRVILELTGSMRFEEIEMPPDVDGLGFEKRSYAESERRRVTLRQVWAEIVILPSNQRKALILNLSELGDTEVVTLILRERIASIAEVAAALEVSLEEFSDIFRLLPMTSSQIAEFLGLEDRERTSKEQRVDNLRSVARRLLRKRLGFRPPRKSND